MTSTDDNRFFFPAWGVSLALHGIVGGLALAFVTHIKPALPEDVFQWDVALVEGTKPAEPVAASAQPPASEMASLQKKRVSNVPEPVRPIAQTIEQPPAQEIEQKVEAPIEQRIVEAAEPKAEPVVEAKEPTPVAVIASTEPVEAQPAQPDPVAIASAPAPTVSRDSTANEAPALGQETQTDNRWLAESLWRRVAELKRYPNSSRMNGQEGKVILRAVIRSDGQLADVFVQKSSGYPALDEAAIEAVKLACPLHMKHAISKPQIVVSLPIVYSLAN